MVSARTLSIAQLQEVHVNPTTSVSPSEQLVTTMSERMAALTRTLSSWMLEQPHSLAELEHHTFRLLKDLGASLLGGLAGLPDAREPARTINCACGQIAAYQRQRSAQVISLLGPIRIARAYYLC